MIFDNSSIEEKEKELANYWDDIVSRLALIRDASRDLERLRLLRLLQAALNDIEKVRNVEEVGISRGREPFPESLHDVTTSTLLNLIAMVKPEEVEEIGVETEEGVGGANARRCHTSCCERVGGCSEQEGARGALVLEDPLAAEEFSRPVRDEKLLKHIIRLMQMSGTVRQGDLARWTVDQLMVGLSNLHPSLERKALLDALAMLTEEDVLIPVSSESGVQFALSDEHAAEPVEVPLDEQILEMLQSAADQNGQHVGWTRNQLVFAVKKNSAKLTKKAIEDEIEKMAEAGRIAVFQGKTTGYVAIDEETMERYKEKLIEIKHEPSPEPEEPQVPGLKDSVGDA